MLSTTLSSSHDLISTVPPVLLLDLEFLLSVIKTAGLTSQSVLEQDVIRASALTVPALLLLSLSAIRNCNVSSVLCFVDNKEKQHLPSAQSFICFSCSFIPLLLFLSSLSSVSVSPSLPWPYCNPITLHWSDACWQGQLDADDAKHHAISSNYFF